MSNAPRIGGVVFSPARELDARLGLLGFIACTLDSLRVDGIALRRTAAGRLDLRFPTSRRGSSGRRFQVVWPADEAARQAIEAQVLAALEQQGVLP